MEEKSVGRSFLILSVAGILVKILSAAYIPLLRAIIGKQGIGIYNASYSYFVFILAITSLGAQPAVAKVVSELRALGHEEDALRAMRLSRRYLAIIGAIITILLTNMVVSILPYLLSFAAGAMIYVVAEELIPESQVGEHSNIGTIGVAIGFAIMMILDVALG